MNSVLFPASLMLFSCFGCSMNIHYTFRVTIRQCVFGWQENSSLWGPSKLSLHFSGSNPMPFPRLSTGCVSNFSAATTEYLKSSLVEKGPFWLLVSEGSHLSWWGRCGSRSVRPLDIHTGITERVWGGARLYNLKATLSDVFPPARLSFLEVP